MAEKRVQRRLAAILAADVVGCSRLMREDEAGTLAPLKTLREEVFDRCTDEHNGRIVQTGPNWDSRRRLRLAAVSGVRERGGIDLLAPVSELVSR